MLEQICNATDALKEIRRQYAIGHATYDDMKAAAVKVLELRQQAERKRLGKVKTKITALSIAQLLRA